LTIVNYEMAMRLTFLLHAGFSMLAWADGFGCAQGLSDRKRPRAGDPGDGDAGESTDLFGLGGCIATASTPRPERGPVSPLLRLWSI
jgi:hypothetical protein